MYKYIALCNIHITYCIGCNVYLIFTAKVPGTLEAALQALEADEVMVEALGRDFVDYFCAVKREGEIGEPK